MRRFGARDRGADIAADETVGAAPGFELRGLAYSDLPAVLAIERRSFPTPWSLAMFVLELSKPSGICLRSEEHTSELQSLAYLVCRLLLEKKNHQPLYHHCSHTLRNAPLLPVDVVSYSSRTSP